MKNKMPLPSLLGALVTMLIGVFVIIGWYTHNDFLRSIAQGQVKVKFNVALGFIFSSTVLLLHFFPGNRKFSKPISVLLCVFISLMGLITLAEYVFGLNIGIDELFIRDEIRSSADYYAGRMAPLLALNFLLIGIGLILINNAKFVIYQFIYLVTVAFFSFLMLVGFNFVTDIPIYYRVAIHGAIGFIALSVAIYSAQPMLKDKITFEIKMFTGFTAAITLIVLISLLYAYYSRKRVQTNRSIAERNLVIGEIAQILSLVKDIEIEENSYSLTSDSTYINYFEKTQGDVLHHVDKLKELTKLDAIQRAKADSLEVLLKEQITLIHQPIQSKNEKGVEPTVQIILERHNNEKIRYLIITLQLRENNLLLQRQRENFDSVGSFNRAFSIFLGCVFILLIVIFFYIRNNIAVHKKSEASLSKLNTELVDRVQDHTKKLEASEKTYRALFENMMHGFAYCQMLYDKKNKAEDFIYLDVNKAHELSTGSRDLVGKKLSDVLPKLKETDRSLFEIIERVSLTGRPEKVETFLQARNRWYSISIYCPQIGYFATLFDDITDVKTTEMKLLESERRFRTLVENSSDAIVLLDEHLNIKYQSSSTERVTGFPIGERLQGAGPKNVHADDVPKIREAFAESSRRPGIAISVQCRTLHRKGHYIWIEGFISNFLDEPSVNAFVVNYRDVTERKTLEEQQALLGLIVNSSDDAILSKTLDGIITSWNFGAQKLFGYQPSEIIGKNVSILIPPDRFGEESEIIGKIRSGEVVDHYETERVKKDGSLISISLTVSPIRNSEGTVIGASKIARDISERKAAAEKLEASERRFRALIENSYDAIVLNDMDSNILYQSPSVSRILGYTQQERVGKPVLDYIHPDDISDFIKLYGDLRESHGRPLAFQYRFRRKNGNFIWLEGVVTNLLHDPSVGAVVANYRDITARKVAEESLELTLSRFKQAQQIAHLGHWELDFETGKTTWSEETFRIFGMEPNSVEPSEEVFLNLIHPEDLEMVKTEIDRSRQALATFAVYHRIVHHHSRVRVLLSVGQYEFDKSEKPLRLYGICLDVTELSEKEKKLEEVNKDLETFIYKSSHDLKSPIASILGFD